VQLAQLRSWADEVAESGAGRFVLVVGEAGIGKTRLCSEFVRRPPEAAVAWARCWDEAGGPPLWPWPDLIAELGAQQDAPEVSGQVPAGRDRFLLFRAMVEQLRVLCAVRPAVVLIDDLHAANHDVLLLTRFIARSLHRFPMLLAATWRTGGPSEASSDLAMMLREGSVVDLPPFLVNDIAEYLKISDHRAVGDDDYNEVSRLFACTGGNPMYVAEIVHHRWDDAGARSGGLALALARRVADVGVEQRRVVGAAALLGAGATVAEVAHVVDRPSWEVVDALGDPRLGVTLVGNVIGFSHELVQAAYAAALPAKEREQLHLAARDVIAGSDVDDAVRRARHAAAAASSSPEDTAVAITACHSAAAGLQRALAFEQAAEWASRAYELASGGRDRDVEATALLTYAEAVLACGRLAEARELFTKAAPLADAASDPRLLARIALGLGGVWVEEQRGELSRRGLVAMCRRALAALPPDEGVLAGRLSVRLAAELAYDGSATVDDVAAQVQRVREFEDPLATAEALSLYHHALLLVPDAVPARLKVAEDLLEVASKAEATIYSLFGLCWRTIDLYQLGDREAERAFIELRERVNALGSQAVGYIVAVLDVMRTLRRGDLDRAEALADEALVLGVAAGDADATSWYGAHVLAVRWVQGRFGELRETVASVIESSTLRRRDHIYPALLAYTTALNGDHVGARSVLDGLFGDGIDGIPRFSTWAGTMGVLVETAAELGDGDLAAALAERFAPVAHLPVMPSLAVACLGPGERVMGRAMATAGRLDDAVAWLREALAANRRLGNRPFGALIRADLALAMRRRSGPGDTDAAAELVASAIEEGRRLGMTGWVRRWEAEDAVPRGRGSVRVPLLRGTFEREDGTWHVEIDGRCVTVKHVVGMRYMAELIARPDTDIPAAELSTAVAGSGVVDRGVSGQPTLDDRARRDYRRRLEQLEDELEVADQRGDVDRGRRAARERDVILDALRRETGLGGRPRRMTDESERSRMRVSRAIHRALAQVDRADRKRRRPTCGCVTATSICTPACGAYPFNMTRA
jgi:tetratricopeptide (TPR) repeat protein